MVTGLCFVLFGVLVLFVPQLLVAMVAGLFILFGAGMMITAWQFRRWHRQSQSPFINWIIRF